MMLRLLVLWILMSALPPGARASGPDTKTYPKLPASDVEDRPAFFDSSGASCGPRPSGPFGAYLIRPDPASCAPRYWPSASRPIEVRAEVSLVFDFHDAGVIIDLWNGERHASAYLDLPGAFPDDWGAGEAEQQSEAYRLMMQSVGLYESILQAPVTFVASAPANLIPYFERVDVDPLNFPPSIQPWKATIRLVEPEGWDGTFRPNSAPQALPTPQSSVGGAATTFSPSVSDIDPEDAGSLSIDLPWTPRHGSATKSGTSVTYVPKCGYNGSDDFFVRVMDASHYAACAAVTVQMSGAYDDCDNDWIANPIDNCADVPNAGQENRDLDTEGDACDWDNDNDGMPDGFDNCEVLSNRDQVDSDDDDVGDVCDNCLLVPNGSQSNWDGDQLGDACDTMSPTSDVRVHPHRTYLHRHQDSNPQRNDAAPEPVLGSNIIDLQALGIQVGTPWKVSLTSLGTFSFTGSWPETGTAMIALFSSSTGLLGPNQLNRVTGAIDAGTDFPTAATHFDNEPTNISEDFLVSGQVLTVPTGARYLFVSPHDTYFQGNRDADQDFKIRIEHSRID